LKANDYVGGDGRKDQAESEPSEVSRPIRNQPLISLVVGFVLLSAAFIMIILAFKTSKNAEDRGLPWWPPLVFWLFIAVVCAYHGIKFFNTP
jgi:hypothetical protein